MSQFQNYSLGKQSSLIVQTEQPFKADSPGACLEQSFITGRGLAFVHNRLAVPQIDPAEYFLIVNGLVTKALLLPLTEIRQFPRTTLTPTLQGLGCRRKELIIPNSTPEDMLRDLASRGTATWSGIRLRDVLMAAGVEPETRYVAFTGRDKLDLKGGRQTYFGSTIPLEKALQPEVLLAYELNGQPLLAVNGFPLRVIVPGYRGACSIKWLTQIELRATPSDNDFQVQP